MAPPRLEQQQQQQPNVGREGSEGGLNLHGQILAWSENGRWGREGNHRMGGLNSFGLSRKAVCDFDALLMRRVKVDVC